MGGAPESFSARHARDIVAVLAGNCRNEHAPIRCVRILSCGGVHCGDDGCLDHLGTRVPIEPVKIIVQTAAGSSLDVVARLVAEPLSQIWGQQPIIVNQAGAGGLIASRALAASPADGYTLFLAGGSVFVALPEVKNNLPFDVTEFVPIGFVAEQPYTLLTSKNLDVNSVLSWSKSPSNSPAGWTTLQVPAGACST